MVGAQGSPYMKANSWQFNLGYRWMESDRHFVGTDEQEERQEEGSEVINKVHLFDVSVTYAFTCLLYTSPSPRDS